ncbi:maleylpyruvate isomerase family mycothiol-dependent enzyme [Streptomyces odontomachi]|uniref:maleylpyruvate isomerase family mycothiol-dependent enzyme n=1 Tax=Streptomyces odontomachi TaxID=2944940 RepID=UPI00210B6E7D|nr:maleylpyruvate isomerase family mycothiol-dependent enzyme [Streptomyces sp. ODS25]
MRTTELIDVTEAEGLLLLSTALGTGWEAGVPSCPGWRMRELVGHQGNVHRWAEEYVRAGLTQPRRVPDEQPADDELAAWFEDGLRRLVASLRAADEGSQAWTFLPGAPDPRAFWARRQAHETTIHRVDAELAAGGAPTPVAPEVALDGVDELLTAWHGRSRSPLRTERPAVLAVRSAEGPEWTLHLGPEAPRPVREAAGRWDCRISGPAQELYLALWNRRSSAGDGLVVEGDEHLMEVWRSKARIA